MMPECVLTSSYCFSIWTHWTTQEDL